jgi:hypothetical protein
MGQRCRYRAKLKRQKAYNKRVKIRIREAIKAAKG